MKQLWIVLALVMVCLSAVPGKTLAHNATATAGATSARSAAATPAIIPTNVTLANTARVSLLSVTYNTDGTSIWRYHVTKTSTTNLSAWALEAPACATVMASTPSGTAPDSSAGFTGIKWTTAADFQQAEFSVTLNGPVTIGSAKVAVTDVTSTTGQIAGPVCTATPITVTLSNGYRITVRSVTFNADGTSIWNYFMEELASAQDLSNWVLELKNCAVVTAAPEPWEVVKPDPNAKLYGVKWQTGAGFQQGEFTVRLRGPLGFGLIQVAAKGPDVVLGQIAGPLCASQAEPPPVIVIDDDDIEQEIERVGGLVFVNISITIVNTGGPARGTFLVLNLADFRELFDLADVSFLIGAGYVVELNDQQVVIGLGQNNIIHGGDKLKVKIKFKAKKNELEIKINAKFQLSYGDGQELVVPTVPISMTQPLSPTTPTSATVVIQRLPISRIDTRFTGTWRSRGGLVIFGLPLTQAIVRPSGVVVQYFERARLEYHPELAGTQYEILLGRLADELGYATPPVAAPTIAAELRWYFPATGHLVARDFRSYWQARGGLLLFGYPIGEAVMVDGRLVQYFERARLERHADLAGTPYEIQLGHLGVQVLEREGGD